MFPRAMVMREILGYSEDRWIAYDWVICLGINAVGTHSFGLHVHEEDLKYSTGVGSGNNPPKCQHFLRFGGVENVQNSQLDRLTERCVLQRTLSCLL